MSVLRFVLLLAFCVGGLAAAEPLATATRQGVTVELTLERGVGAEAALFARFVPKQAGFHLYGLELTGTIGVATRVALAPDAPARATGPATADHATHLQEDLPVFPAGPVTLRLPIALPVRPDGAAVAATVLVDYMACSEETCLIPVRGLALAVSLPSVTTGGAVPVAAPDAAAVRQIVREEVRRALAEPGQAEPATDGIRWRRVADVAAVEAALAEAKAQGRAALLDFTGPSCVNCQLMARTVFRLPAVIAAWNRGLPILVNTDPPHEALADWQQRRFATQARPLYIRIAPDGTTTRWSEVFAATDRAAEERFLAFLAGGEGADAGTGDGWLAFLLLACAGGLVTLVMPCTYPMIPFTLNVFAKQAVTGRSPVPLAAAYAGGIILCFVGLGVVVTGVFGANLATLAGHPLTNLLIAVLFIAFGLSLLGVWFMRLPAGLTAHVGGGRAGVLGALGMGLTFAVTAFTCTAPFAGTVLAQAVASGAWTRPIIGMAVYAGTIAVPFFLLALSPSWLQRLPRAGAWMGEFKVVGGLVELAAALKFLVIADVAWGWGVVGRDPVLACWAAAAGGTGLYLSGLIRLPGDERITAVGPWRLLLVLAFIALALWLAAGLAGRDLGLVESFFPQP